MAHFIKLTQPQGDPFWFNMDQVLFFKRTEKGAGTMLIFANGNEQPKIVRESPDQVYALSEDERGSQ